MTLSGVRVTKDLLMSGRTSPPNAHFRGLTAHFAENWHDQITEVCREFYENGYDDVKKLQP